MKSWQKRTYNGKVSVGFFSGSVKKVKGLKGLKKLNLKGLVGKDQLKGI